MENFIDHEDLPDEIWLKICQSLPAADLLRLSETGVRFYNITKDNKIWKNCFKIDYPEIVFLIKNDVEMNIYKNPEFRWLDVYAITYQKQLSRARQRKDELGRTKLPTISPFPTIELFNIIPAVIQLASNIH